MVARKSNKGVVIDMESLLAQSGDERAVGNMNVNARGDVVGAQGEIIQKAEDRVKAYYEANPKSSTAQQSLKGAMPDTPEQVQSDMAPELKTAEAEKTEASQSVMDQVDPASVPAPETIQEEVSKVDENRTVVSYKEVELPNGDIEMVPVYEDDWTEDD
tara:strand:+ start:2612 stop:3088 length:477 start_codon:yes stop_codon:yes gene_type:complete